MEAAAVVRESREHLQQHVLIASVGAAFLAAGAGVHAEQPYCNSGRLAPSAPQLQQTAPAGSLAKCMTCPRPFEVTTHPQPCSVHDLPPPPVKPQHNRTGGAAARVPSGRAGVHLQLAPA